jgi:phosphopantothenoylcysteine synthetase/decarboxylase
MYAAVAQHIGTCHAAIFCAAVADFRPKRLREQKIKKSEEMLLLELERTPDILGSARTKFGFHGLLVGFAAETDQVVAYAKAKLASKGCDLLLANDVSQPQSGFEVDVNQVRLLYADGREDPWPCMTKKEIGSRLVALLEGLHQAKTKQHRA